MTIADANVVFYACRLCLRLYTLKNDLRGHMLEYHKWLPTNRTEDFKTKHSKGTQAAGKGDNQSAATSADLAAANNAAKDTSTGDTSVRPELRPMPFKSFRLLLRSKLPLRCPVTYACAYKFENAAKLKLHKKCHVNNEFKCFKCAMDMSNWRQCSAHLWKAHQIDVDLLHCPVCFIFMAHTTVHIWRHMRTHKKWRPVVLRTLRAVQKRREEQKRITNGTTLPAPTPAVVVNKNKYYAEKTCQICNRKFVNGKTLSKHVKTVHNKIKPFICNVCGMKTARKASLIIHMRQHTGEKPLHCKACKFSTRDPSVLNKHQQRHNKNGVFKCAHCTYTCIQTIALKRHMRLKHPEEFKKIACDLCSFVTTNEKTLSIHKEDHRRGLIVNPDDSMDASRNDFKNPRKLHDKNNEMSADCFLPLESIDSLPHEPTVDTGGVTIPAPPSEDTQFPTYLNN